MATAAVGTHPTGMHTCLTGILRHGLVKQILHNSEFIKCERERATQDILVPFTASQSKLLWPSSGHKEEKKTF